jgi:hypothetical protein
MSTHTLTPKGREVWEAVQRALSPEVLREHVVLRYERWRESYVAEEPASLSYDDVEAALDRFFYHMHTHRWFYPHPPPRTKEEWAAQFPERPPKTNEEWASYLKDSREWSKNDYKDWFRERHGSGIETLRRVRRIIADHGMRAACNFLTRELEHDYLRRYLRREVEYPIEHAPLEDQIPLMFAYVEQYRALPHITTDNPVMVCRDWSTVLHQHAKIILGWD